METPFRSRATSRASPAITSSCADDASDSVTTITATTVLVERWRWISLALPPDLLVAALAATRNVSPPSEHVELVTAHLARTLQAPCAETHLHVGAAIPFGVLWMGVVRSLADKGNHRELVAWLRGSFAGVIPFGDADRFLHLLRDASLARVAMAAFLRAHDNGAPADFDKYVLNWMRGVASKVPWEWGPRDVRAGLSAMLGLVIAPRSKIALSHERARALLRAVLGKAPAAVDDPHLAAVDADPLSAWLTQRAHPALPETRFASRAIAYLLGPGVADNGFARMFWQYQRLRGATYRTLAQEPGIAGLHWFTRFYGRISFFRKLLPLHRGYEASWSHALRTESRDLNLGALETRTSPDATIDGNRNLLRAVTRQARAFTPDDGGARPEIGLVLHFIKEDAFKQNGRQHLHADPANLAFGARHAVWFSRQRRSAVAVASALRDHPELLLVLRGIDVANLEQAQPAWVLRPLFDIVRDASERASRRLAHAVPGWRVPPVRATLHAGEDYLRITEGLRRMHEAIEFGLLRQGDRFGHGLAVGANPETERGTTVAQPREERLDDLLWELDRYAHGDFNGSAARIEKVRHDATALARELFLQGTARRWSRCSKRAGSATTRACSSGCAIPPSTRREVPPSTSRGSSSWSTSPTARPSTVDAPPSPSRAPRRSARCSSRRSDGCSASSRGERSPSSRTRRATCSSATCTRWASTPR